jgi:hypothetical protein
MCPQWRTPLGSLNRRQPPTRHEAMQKARLLVHRRSACSGVKALRNTSAARRRAAKLCYCFGPLTPSARSANLIAGDRDEERLSRSEQRTGLNQKQPLDTKSPIQVRIRFSPPVGHTNPMIENESGRRPAMTSAAGTRVETPTANPMLGLTASAAPASAPCKPCTHDSTPPSTARSKSGPKDAQCCPSSGFLRQRAG